MRIEHLKMELEWKHSSEKYFEVYSILFLTEDDGSLL